MCRGGLASPVSRRSRALSYQSARVCARCLRLTVGSGSNGRRTRHVIKSRVPTTVRSTRHHARHAPRNLNRNSHVRGRYSNGHVIPVRWRCVQHRWVQLGLGTWVHRGSRANRAARMADGGRARAVRGMVKLFITIALTWFLLCQICLLAEELDNNEGRLGWGEGIFCEQGTRGRQADPRHQPKIRWGAPTPKGGGRA